MIARPHAPRTSVACALVALLAAACASSASDPPAERTGASASAIINGQLDTTHQAVVAVAQQQGDQGGLCTGTIVKVDPATKIGWVLTAAHCVSTPPVFVLMGDDIQSQSVVPFEVIDWKADPRYTGQTASSYDFAVVRVAGMDGATPTIALASAPDGLATNQPVLSVGYGRTTLLSQAPDNNTKRRSVARNLSQIGGTQIAFSMRTAGICQGDSGGPVLVGSPPNEIVVGVHSYVQGDCNGTGVSGRVTAGATFIAGELDRPPPPNDCSFCKKTANSGSGACIDASRRCLTDKECSAYVDCANACKDRPCVKACGDKHPRGEGLALAAQNCVCTQACTAQCKDQIDCFGVPKCGYKFEADACADCMQAQCCDDVAACSTDGACYACLKTSDGQPDCSTNAPRKKLANCAASKCSAQCAGSSVSNGADPPKAGAPEEGSDGAGGGGQTVTTTSGCAASPSRSSGAGAAWLLAVSLAAALARRARHARR